MRGWRIATCTFQAAKASQRCHFATTRSCHEQIRSLAELLQRDQPEENVTINGWVRSLRRQKRVAFVALADGSTVNPLQAVLTPDQADSVSVGTAVSLHGQWKQSQGANQNFELAVRNVSVQGENDSVNTPLQPKYHTAEYLRTIPHLRQRTPANSLLLRLRSQVIASLTRYFNENDFVQTHTPIITSSDCEGAGEVFTVSSSAVRTTEQPETRAKPANEVGGDNAFEHFFRSPKYLTVSAQLHLEALAQAVNRVWTLSPTFRAERSDTNRHLSEFYMLEAEQCFVNDLDAVMDVVEGMLRAVAEDLAQSRVAMQLLHLRQSMTGSDEEDGHAAISAEELARRWDGLVSTGWRRITYADAIQKLQKSGFKVTYEDGLSAEHERALANEDEKRRPIFITDYPREQKPFYMPPSQDTSPSRGSSDTSACFDLLVPDLCELVGGSIREHRSKELLRAMQDKGVAGSNLEWYQDLRRYGSVPHGGFGLGFDRLLCYLSGISNIRDVVAFPRWYGRCDC